MPEEEARQQTAAGYPQQMQRVLLQQQQYVRPFDYVGDALRQQQRALQQQDSLQIALVRAQNEAERMRAELQRQQQLQQQPVGPVLSESDIQRLTERLAQQIRAEPELSPQQREQARRRLYDEVYDGDRADSSDLTEDRAADHRSRPADTGETFAPVPWGPETEVKRISVVGE